MLVLELLAKKSMYGYEMIQTLKAASEDFFALKEGTLYPILYRLRTMILQKAAGLSRKMARHLRNIMK